MMPNRWLMNELAHDFRKFRSFIKDGVVCVTDCPMTAEERENQNFNLFGNDPALQYTVVT